MKRKLSTSAGFLRDMRHVVRRNPQTAEALRKTLILLEEDAFDPRLHTHKLKGKFAGTWASSAGYDLRIVFEILPHDGGEVIHLLTVGTHDEVY